MASMKSRAQGVSIQTVEASPERTDPCTEDLDDIECESLSQLQPSANFLVDVTSSQDPECSQAPTKGLPVVHSQQPSPEFLISLGIKVRDFAYENTLPAIVPVPRVPRQVQPAPRALKRSHRDWDDKEGSMDSISPVRPLPGQLETKRPRSLERKATEPLQEPEVQHPRTLERITVKRVCSILRPPSQRTVPTIPHTRFSASPPTSPLTPPHASQESEHVHQTSPVFPFIVHVDNTGVMPASRLNSESRSVPPHPVLYTSFTLDSCPSSGYIPAAPGSPQSSPPAPLISSFREVPALSKEPRVPRARGRRPRGTPPSLNRYQLRQRPVQSSRTSSISHQVNSTSKSLPQRACRVRVKS